MVEHKHVDLDASAESVGLSTDDFRFIKHDAMSLGSFLCFAAVEYDDLFSLQWLCKTHGYPLEYCQGMNVLHVAALFGRIEILGWFHQSDDKVWNHLAGQICKNKEFDGAYLVHIAAGQGHLNVAEMLLEFECNQLDVNGKSPEDYGKKAPCMKSLALDRDYEFVHDWTCKQSVDSKLEKDVHELLNLLQDRKPGRLLKDHIINSACLDIEAWIHSGCYSCDKPSLNGLTYATIVDKCLSSGDIAFVEWLVMKIHMGTDIYHESFWGGERHAGRLKQGDLLKLAKSKSKEEIVYALSHPLISEVSCIDPSDLPTFSLPSLKSNDFSHYLQSKLIWVKTLVSIANAIDRGIPAVVGNSGNPSELQDLIAIYDSVRHLLKAEGMFSPELYANCWELRRIANETNLLK